jgi:hypothetical protein
MGGRRGKGVWLRERQGKERKVTEESQRWAGVEEEGDRKGGRKVKRRQPKGGRMPHKKTSSVAGNLWGKGLKINARAYREVVSAVRLGVEKQKHHAAMW